MPPTASTKERIVEVASDLFATNGYHATGVAEISDAVGLGRGALYHHIKSKEELLFLIVNRSITDLVAEAEVTMGADLPVLGRLRELSRGLMRHNAEHLAAATVFTREYSSLTGRNREVVEARRARYEVLWTTLLDDGAADGVLRAVDPVLIKGILGMYNQAYLWIRADGRLSTDEIADAFLDVLLQGLTPRG